MRKILLAILLFSLFSVPVLTGEENKENENTYWSRNNVEHNGYLLNVYLAKTTEQFLNTCEYTMQNELGLYAYNMFDVRKLNNNFISIEGIKKNYPKFYKTIEKNTDKIDYEGYKYMWYGVTLNEYSYLVYVFTKIGDKEYVSMYSLGMYTFTLLATLEQSL